MKLIAKNISKTIHGHEILKNIDLELESGLVYGFVGRNGSGKTMLFRALSGLIHIDEGTISYDGKILGKDMTVLPSVGIVLENAGLYPEKTCFGNLKYLASLKKQIGPEEIRDALERVGLDPDDKRTYRKYSLGMRQRLAIAQAIMEQPEVLMLDEPTNGLDEDGVNLIRSIVLAEKTRGAIVLIASHVKEDISLLADQIIYLKDGRITEIKTN